MSRVADWLGEFFVHDRGLSRQRGVYVKDFDGWCEVLKNIGRRRVPPFRAREIWWCLWGVNADNELDGTGNMFERPVLIMEKQRGSRKCFVIPLTSRIDESDSGYYKYGNGSLSLWDARTISAKRLLNRKSVMHKRPFGVVKKLFGERMGLKSGE